MAEDQFTDSVVPGTSDSIYLPIRKFIITFTVNWYHCLESIEVCYLDILVRIFTFLLYFVIC